MGVLGRDAELGRIEAWLDGEGATEPAPVAGGTALAFAVRRLGERPVRLLASVRIGYAPQRGAPRPQGSAERRTGAFATVEASLDPQAVRRLPVGPLSVAATHQMFRQALGMSFPRP